MKNLFKNFLKANATVLEYLTAIKSDKIDDVHKQQPPPPNDQLIKRSNYCASCQKDLDYVDGDQHLLRQGCEVNCELTRAK